MERINLTTVIENLSYGDLSDDDKALVDLAREACLRAYAPYSNFSVGAAIRLDNGESISAANQENAAFPSGTCAERAACFYAHAKFPDAKFSAVAVAARGTDGNEVKKPISPCGACRQALLEYEILARQDIPLLLVGQDSIYRVNSVKSLLPLAFSEF